MSLRGAMNNSRWGGSVPINRLLKKPNPALNRETNSHPPKPQTPAQPLMNLSSPERGCNTAVAGREAGPCALSRPSQDGICSSCQAEQQSPRGALLGSLVAVALGPCEPAVSRMAPAPWAWFDPFISLGPLLKATCGAEGSEPPLQ